MGGLRGLAGSAEAELAVAMYPARPPPVARVRGIRDGELSTGRVRRIVHGQDFRNRRHATISVARLTVSEVSGGATGHPGAKTLRLVVDASRLVMAIWSLSTIKDIPDRLPHGALLPMEHQA